MEFNPNKCEVFRIHSKQKPVIFPYKLHATTLRTTENAKYIAVTISSNLYWSSQTNTITNLTRPKTVWDLSNNMSQHKTRELKWSTIEQRRNQASLIMLHKIHKKPVIVDHSHLTTTNPYSPLNRKHRINSFFPRVIRLWNRLQWTRQFRVIDSSGSPSHEHFCFSRMSRYTDLLIIQSFSQIY